MAGKMKPEAIKKWLLGYLDQLPEDYYNKNWVIKIGDNFTVMFDLAEPEAREKIEESIETYGGWG